ncbi:MAG: hypothetical protein KTU85_02510 [Acidimicrobiia bacterium]|nr:hypothetical protein [Acidimicrobiia bacterium]MCY4458415.1 hypothetical protein [Acidimicrobiaceae bacterium]
MPQSPFHPQMRKVASNLTMLSSGCNRFAALFLIFILSTCAASPSAEPNDDSDPIADYELLYELYLGDPNNLSDAAIDYERQLYSSTQDKIRACMAQSGFEYVPDPPPNRINDTNLTEEDAVVFGFGISLDAYVATDNDVDPVRKVESREYRGALYDAGGCFDQARELETSFSSIFADYHKDFAKVWESYVSDPRVTEADTKWASCMKQAGFDVNDLNELQNNIRTMLIQSSGLPEIQSVQRYEIAAALAHVDCNIGLTEIHDSVIAELSTQFDEQYKNEIIARLSSPVK